MFKKYKVIGYQINYIDPHCHGKEISLTFTKYELILQFPDRFESFIFTKTHVIMLSSTRFSERLGSKIVTQ